MAGQFTRAKAERLWTNYNKDNNDTLTVDEVKGCIKDLYGFVDDDDVKEKYVFFGQKEAKDLTKDEFITGMLSVNKCSELQTLFKNIDKNGDNNLTGEELKDGLKPGPSLTQEQIKIIIEELDEDTDKRYTCDEFIDAVKFSKTFSSLF